MATQPALPQEVWGMFSDQINQASVQRIFNTFGVASNGGVKCIHILFQTSGGFVADGISLYNFFRTVPVEVTLYNSGSIQSIGTIAFLGCQRRKVSASGTFHIHLTSGPQRAATVTQLEGIIEGIKLDDERTEAILRRHVKLPEDRWTQLRSRDLTFSAKEGLEFGFADEIVDFSPAPGAKIFNI
jgi:ATP-dependent Clp protease, protease subunit